MQGIGSRDEGCVLEERQRANLAQVRRTHEIEKCINREPKDKSDALLSCKEFNCFRLFQGNITQKERKWQDKTS